MESDGTSVEAFRQSLIQGWGGGEIGSSSSRTDWAKLIEPSQLHAGDVLLGLPLGFLGDGSGSGPRRIGSRRLSQDRPRRELLLMLPVVLLTHVADDGAAIGVMLTVRTGRLMGDYVNHFHSRPLHYGGPDESDLTMVHPYKEVPGSQLLSKDSGIYLGGRFAGAQEWVEEGQGSSLRFRFFCNCIRWAPGDLARELLPGSHERTWIAVRCSRDMILTEVDAMDEKPLWAQIAELAGGEAEESGRQFDLLD